MILDFIRRAVVRWFQRNREQEEIDEAKRFTEDTAYGFWALYHLALTWHGRYQLKNILDAADDLDVDPKVLSMYKVVLEIAPYRAYATIN